MSEEDFFHLQRQVEGKLEPAFNTLLFALFFNNEVNIHPWHPNYIVM